VWASSVARTDIAPNLIAYLLFWESCAVLTLLRNIGNLHPKTGRRITQIAYFRDGERFFSARAPPSRHDALCRIDNPVVRKGACIG
jgi:hypothetical protein